MASYRFRKSISLGNGVRMNIGKNGVSTSMKVGNTTFTTGSRGSYVTNSIPGTGISFREKIGGNYSSSHGGSPTNNSPIRNSGGPSAWLIIAIILGIALGALLISNNMTDTIIPYIIGGVIIICLLIIFISKLIIKADIRKRAQLLGEALEDEENQKLAQIQANVDNIKEQLKQETNPLKRKALEAYISNYPFVQWHNLYLARKKGFESRPDFKQQFVQDYYEENNAKLASLKEEIFMFDNPFTKSELDFYRSFRFAYSTLRSHARSANGSRLEIEPQDFFYLKTDEQETPSFETSEGRIFFFPTFIINFKGGSDISFLEYSDLKPTYKESYVSTSNRLDVPVGATIVRQSWLYMTKSGQPDARYSNNPCTTTYKLASLLFAPFTIPYLFSDLVATEALIDVIKQASSPLVKKNNVIEENDIILDDTFEPNESEGEDWDFNAINLRRALDDEPLFIDVARFTCSQQYISISTIQRHFSIGYNKSGKIVDLMESLGIIGMALSGKHMVQRNSNAFELLLERATKLSPLNNTPNVEEQPKGKHKVGDKHPTKPWVWTEYAPGKFDWRKDKEADGSKSSTPKPKENSNATKELNSLIGLASVKDEIAKLQNFINIQLVRQSQGLKTSPISYHCVFTGNPGTGKTTVARIVAEIYRDLGILKKGHLVETDRSGLVAEYVGQTAVKTNKVIDSALDGVLFIDEAYSLAPSSSTDFGHEAIATLLKRMEDDRDRLVVILAGYGNEMQSFIDANPGLQSRFNRYIHFDDYSAEDLLAIFELNLKKHQYKMSESAKTLLKSYLDNAVANKDKNFGNGRFVRNVFEKTLQNQATRLSAIDSLSKEDLQLIVDEDIPTK